MLNKRRDITTPRPTCEWLFKNRRTLEQARADRQTLRALETGALKIHPAALTREPWATLLFRRDAAL
jgi:hypothetical protein